MFQKRRPVLNLKMQEIIPSEYQECKVFWQYAQKKGFSDDLIKHANERKEEGGGWFIRALMAIGFRKGLPDYQYIVPNEKYHTLWIEMKRKDGREKKKDFHQEAWIERLSRSGHYATYAYGFDDAIKIFYDYVNNKL